MSISSAPTENSKGNKVWKPEVGIVFDPAFGRQHSYGGIIGALQDAIAVEGDAPKAYPHNFAGIIAALQDLEAAQAAPPPVVIQPIPPGSEIDSNTGDLNIIIPPDDGLLWFDSRQGRLFVAADDEWWQTNGADGLAYIRTDVNPPTSDVAPGQFWYEPNHGDLYVNDGTDWVLIANKDSGAKLQTTGTLPLEYAVNQYPFGSPPDEVYSFGFDVDKLPINIDNPLSRIMVTQEHFNNWLLDSIWDLDQATTSKIDNIHIDLLPPAIPEVGNLWFDTNDLTTSIYYDDGNTKQWVPIHSGYDTALALRNIEQRLNYETDERLLTLTNLELAQQRLKEALDPLVTLRPTLEAIEGRTLADSVTLSELKESHSAQLTSQAAQLQALDLSNTSVTDTVSALTAIINSHSYTLSELAEADTADATTVLALISQLQTDNNSQDAEITNRVTTATFNQKVQELNNNQQNYLLKSGGTFKGQLAIEHDDISKAGIDFSASAVNSRSALKFQTHGEEILEIGTMDTPRQFGFNTTGKQEIVVVNDGIKQLSVTKGGVYANQLRLGDFLENTSDGLVVSNIIDVKDRLTKYQQAFESMRQSVVLSNTFDEFKVELSEILSKL